VSRSFAAVSASGDSAEALESRNSIVVVETHCLAEVVATHNFAVEAQTHNFAEEARNFAEEARNRKGSLAVDLAELPTTHSFVAEVHHIQKRLAAFPCPDL